MSKFLNCTYHGSGKPCLIALDDIANIVPARGEGNGCWINRKTGSYGYGIHVSEEVTVIREWLNRAGFTENPGP